MTHLQPHEMTLGSSWFSRWVQHIAMIPLVYSRIISLFFFHKAIFRILYKKEPEQLAAPNETSNYHDGFPLNQLPRNMSNLAHSEHSSAILGVQFAVMIIKPQPAAQNVKTNNHWSFVHWCIQAKPRCNFQISWSRAGHVGLSLSSKYSLGKFSLT